MKRQQLGFLTKTVNLIFYLIVALCLILFFWNIVAEVNLEKNLGSYTRLSGPFFIIISLFLLTNIFLQIRSATSEWFNRQEEPGPSSPGSKHNHHYRWKGSSQDLQRSEIQEMQHRDPGWIVP